MQEWNRVVVLLAPMALVVGMPLGAQPPSLDDVVGRLLAYGAGYGPRLADIVAEEHYTQWVETEPGIVVIPPLSVTRRVIRSDYVLTQLEDGETWVAFRDAFEVDGVPVRDREDRLVALLSRGGTAAWRQAEAIANESARFNIGTRLITRNINVPTFVLQLLRPGLHQRFRFTRARGDGGRDAAVAGPGGAPLPADGRPADVWQIEFRERDRPTIVRQARNGGDQPLRGTMAVDPRTGAVWATHLTWERGPGGHISVTYDRVPEVSGLVPVRMVEEYRDGRTFIRGEATYRNFRQFETSSRVLTP